MDDLTVTLREDEVLNILVMTCTNLDQAIKTAVHMHRDAKEGDEVLWSNIIISLQRMNTRSKG